MIEVAANSLLVRERLGINTGPINLKLVTALIVKKELEDKRKLCKTV